MGLGIKYVILANH